MIYPISVYVQRHWPDKHSAYKLSPPWCNISLLCNTSTELNVRSALSGIFKKKKSFTYIFPVQAVNNSKRLIFLNFT